MAKKPIKITEVVLRDAHQSLLATRMTMDEMRPILPEMDKIPYFSVECCGGDRDAGKRPVMGGIAVRLADEVVVTSDNPRTEDPDAIIADISAGASGARVVTDRTEAIHHAIAEADGADVVLIAGKGHEDYQEINGVKHHFSDSEVVREAFNERRVQMLRAVEGV